MAEGNQIKKNNNSLTGKIVIALLLAGIAFAISWAITRYTFSEILGTVNRLSQPNPKLQLVGGILRDVVELDQLQRSQALKNSPRTYNPFLTESKDLKLKLDTLKGMSSNNEIQLLRIDSMKKILDERDRIFLSYLGLRNDFIKNDTLSVQIKSLADIVTEAAQNIDSNIVTTERKITTTTVKDDTTHKESKKSFWDKVLGRKKAPEVVLVKQLIQEELNIKIDTLAHTREDSLIQQLSYAISIAESDRSNKRNKLVNRQVELNRAGNILISQLLSILQDIESEELEAVQVSNSYATNIVNTGIERMSLILIIVITGTVVLAFMIFTDIARSSRYKKELLAAKEEAEALGQVKQRFLANMSHELRTPLQAIIGIAEQVKGKANAEGKDIDIIYHSSQHLLQTVNEVLDYSRIVSGKLSLEDKPFNIRDVIYAVFAALKVKADQKNIDFLLQYDFDGDAQYIGDAFRLRQVLYNIIGNAIKFTSSGHVQFTISAKDFDTRTNFSFIVSDTGSGIAHEDIAHIFNQFEQGSDKAHQQYGTGLGLSIVKQLVDLQKGTIIVDSIKGQGSTFTVHLSYPKLAKEQRQNKAYSTPIAGSGISVWLVDDDVFILQLCSTILSKNNIPYQSFSSATDLLNHQYTALPDIILMDIRMPGMDGFELCRILRDTHGSKIKYYALTAQALPEEKEAILRAGFNGLLMKPFMENDLLQILATGPSSNTVPPNDMLTVLEKMTYGDKALMRSILQSFITETLGDLAQLQQTTENAAVAEHLHKLASRCAQFGATELGKSLRTAEKAYRAETHYDLSALYPAIETLIRRAEASLHAL